MKTSEKEIHLLIKEVAARLLEKNLQMFGNGDCYQMQALYDQKEPSQIVSIEEIEFTVTDLTYSKTRKRTIKAVLHMYFDIVSVFRDDNNYDISVFDVLEGKTKQLIRNRRIRQVLED